MDTVLPDQREARRLRAIAAIQQGFTQTHVAAMLGITTSSVSNWALRFRAGGIEELRAKPKGRPPGGQLSAQQIGSIVETLLTRCADEVGLETRLWTWQAVQALIFRSCGIELSRWTVARYLSSWGFKPPNSSGRADVLNRRPAGTRDARGEAMRRRGILYAVARTAFAPDGGAPPGEAITILWALGARAEAAFMAVPERELSGRLAGFFDRLSDHCGRRTCTVVIDDELRREVCLVSAIGNRAIVIDSSGCEPPSLAIGSDTVRRDSLSDAAAVVAQQDEAPIESR